MRRTLMKLWNGKFTKNWNDTGRGKDLCIKEGVYALLTTKELDREQTKGTVLLVCLRCVDTLVLALKHAEACPYVVMWFAPSLIVAGMNHRISSRLTQIQRNSTRRWFVGICVNLWQENPHDKSFVWFVEFVVLKPSHKLAQIFTNYFGAKWPVSQ